ncbi:P-loop containing nucleoside triphosphate hydrolase protein [Xylariaceae sp. FL0255]|nr:P-loop containing nucleoside triphosphate hydrolase protein [Xylariaceae sp. FL0255]
MEMARCRSKTAPQYRAVVGVLKHFMRHRIASGDDSRTQRSDTAAHVASTRGEETQGSNSQARHYIPLPKNDRFTRRTSVLGRLQRRLFTENGGHKLTLVGLGGVGKTQVALHLAYWVKATRPDYSVFWVPALSNKSFEQAYTEMARRLGIRVDKKDEDLKESVRQYLESDTAGRWLLIVDNADDMETLFGHPDEPGGIDEHLPYGENEVAVAVAVSNVVDLHEMSQEKATEFLEKTLINQQLLRDQATTEELLRELTYLPLAITQAAAYLNQNTISIREYLSSLKGTQQDLISLLSRNFQDNTRYRRSDNAVATTWLVSFEQIRRDGATAAELLSFLSCIESKAIPRSILPQFQIQEEMQHAIGVLCGYAFLVRRGDENVYDMHRLHDAVDETGRSAIHHLALIFPWDDKKNCLLWRKYMPHALYALQHCNEYRGAERFDLYYRVGRCLSEDRRFKEAVQALEETYRWRKQIFYEEDHSRLASEHELASAYLDDQRIIEAVELLEHVVAIEYMGELSDGRAKIGPLPQLQGRYEENAQGWVLELPDSWEPITNIC